MRWTAGEELCLVHGEDEDEGGRGMRLWTAAFEIGDVAAVPGPRVLEEITQA